MPESHSKYRTPRNIVAKRVREARGTRPSPLTQDQLSGRLATIGVLIDRGMIAKIETGRRCVYDYEVVALAKALGVEVSWLLGDGVELRLKPSPK